MCVFLNHDYIKYGYVDFDIIDHSCRSTILTMTTHSHSELLGYLNIDIKGYHPHVLLASFFSSGSIHTSTMFEL
jgi:uncharacterized membrane protein